MKNVVEHEFAERTIERVHALHRDQNSIVGISKLMNMPAKVVDAIIRYDQEILKSAIRDLIRGVNTMDFSLSNRIISKQYAITPVTLRMIASFFIPTYIVRVDSKDYSTIVKMVSNDKKSFEQIEIETGIQINALKKIYKPYIKPVISPRVVINRLMKGQSISSIADASNISSSQVMTIARRVDPSLRKLSDVNYMRIKYAHHQNDNGVPLVDIAKKMNESVLTITRWLLNDISKSQPVRIASLPEEVRQEILDRYLKGSARSALAFEYNVFKSDLIEFLKGKIKRGRRTVDHQVVSDLSKSGTIPQQLYQLLKEKNLKHVMKTLSMVMYQTLQVIHPDDKPEYLDIEKGSICPQINFPDGSMLDYLLWEIIKSKDYSAYLDYDISYQCMNEFTKERFYAMRTWLLRDQYKLYKHITIPKVLLPTENKKTTTRKFSNR